MKTKKTNSPNLPPNNTQKHAFANYNTNKIRTNINPILPQQQHIIQLGLIDCLVDINKEMDKSTTKKCHGWWRGDTHI
jgi:hypothetical protein